MLGSSRSSKRHSHLKNDEVATSHHEQKPGVQRLFRKQTLELVAAIEEFGNPNTEESNDLLVLDTRDILDASVIETLKKVEGEGKRQYDAFVEERLVYKSKSVYDVIPQNKFAIFRTPLSRSASKDKLQIAFLKQNCSLFSRLYISCQVRNGNLDEFFRHKNQDSPPSISSMGCLRSGNKADLIQCLEKETRRTPVNSIPITDAYLIDEAASVNMLQPGASRTFQEYADLVFVPYITFTLIELKDLIPIDLIV